MLKRTKWVRVMEAERAKYAHLKGKKYRHEGYIWEICSVLIRIDGTFLYLMRREEKRIIMQEVSLNEELVIGGVNEEATTGAEAGSSKTTVC